MSCHSVEQAKQMGPAREDGYVRSNCTKRLVDRWCPVNRTESNLKSQIEELSSICLHSTEQFFVRDSTLSSDEEADPHAKRMHVLAILARDLLGTNIDERPPSEVKLVVSRTLQLTVLTIDARFYVLEYTTR